MADYISQHATEPLANLRKRLTDLYEDDWNRALGDEGKTYRKVCRILGELNKELPKQGANFLL